MDVNSFLFGALAATILIWVLSYAFCGSYERMRDNREKNKYLKCFIKQQMKSDSCMERCYGDDLFTARKNCFACPYLVERHRRGR